MVVNVASTRYTKINYLKPGPMRCTRESLAALAEPIFSHRTQRFRDIYMEVIERTARILGTQGRVVPLCASGSGGVEFILSNLITKHDKVLVLVNGHFSYRLAQQIIPYSLMTHFEPITLGSSATAEEVANLLEHDAFSVVAMVSNETSTGAWSDMKGIGKVCQDEGVMLLVDHVSGVGNEFKMDEWGIDAAVATTHESFVAPPGIALVAFSHRAVDKANTNHHTTYLHLPRYLKFQDEGHEPPYTMPTTLMNGLLTNLRALERFPNEYYVSECAKKAEFARRELHRVGYPTFTSPTSYSNTVTAFEADDALAVVQRLRTKGIEVATGKDHLKETTFRVSHCGAVQTADLEQLVEALQ